MTFGPSAAPARPAAHGRGGVLRSAASEVRSAGEPGSRNGSRWCAQAGSAALSVAVVRIQTAEYLGLVSRTRVQPQFWQT